MHNSRETGSICANLKYTNFSYILCYGSGYWNALRCLGCYVSCISEQLGSQIRTVSIIKLDINGILRTMTSYSMTWSGVKWYFVTIYGTTNNTETWSRMGEVYFHFTSWWCHQMETYSALLALCTGNSPVPVNSPHNGQWRGALKFSLICARINGWVNNREAGGLRRHQALCDVIVMWYKKQHRNIE